jgi:DNA-binding CsgD family transcriptional regulator
VRMVTAAETHYAAGAFERAIGLIWSAEARPLDERTRARVEVLRGRLAVVHGDPREAAGHQLDAALRLRSIDAMAASYAYLQALSTACSVGSFSVVGIEEVAQHAPVPGGSEPTVVGAALGVGLGLATVEGARRAAPWLRRALDEPGLTVDRTALGMLGAQLGAATMLWDIESFRRLARTHVDVARTAGALYALPMALNSLAQAMVFEGDLDGAAAAVGEANEIVEITSNHRPPSVSALHAGLAGMPEAEAIIESQITIARARGFGLALRSALWARAALLNGMGRHAEAFEAGSLAIEQRWEWSGHLFFHELVEAAARTGRDDVARAALARLEDTVDAAASDWALGVRSRCTALLARDDVADDLYRESIERLGRTALRPELARAHLLHGEWLCRNRRRAEGRRALRRAHELYSAMGARRFADRAERELKAIGEAAPTRVARRLDGLTDQEAQIARLAAEGWTNSEIGAQLYISPRTVEYHLRKVFTKVGVTSRHDLAASVTDAS